MPTHFHDCIRYLKKKLCDAKFSCTVLYGLKLGLVRKKQWLKTRLAEDAKFVRFILS